MSISTLVGVLCLLTVLGYFLGRRRAVATVGGVSSALHSRPNYYGYFVAVWCGIPAMLVLAVWLIVQPKLVDSMLADTLPEDVVAQGDSTVAFELTKIKNLAGGDIVAPPIEDYHRAGAERLAELNAIGDWAMVAVVFALAAGGIAWGYTRIKPSLRARNRVERVVMVALILSATIAILTTGGIVLSLLFETSRFFAKVPLTEFLFGTHWNPQTAMRGDQVASEGSFGAIPVFGGTMLITLIAMLVAVPVGLLSAIYLSVYAPQLVRSWVKPILEILAGVPTVVYGFFAAITVAPQLVGLGEWLGVDVAAESALVAGAVMGIMIIPFISSLSDDVINAVPQAMRDGSYGLGATKSETIKRVILPAALPGIVGAVLLAVSRAIGETMIVVMAVGQGANLTANPLESVTTVTVQIVTVLTGDTEFDSPKTLSAFALGLSLFIVTLILNVVALRVVRKYREKYE